MQAHGSTRCFAAGAQRWVSFRDHVGGPYCSPTSALILRWGAILKPGRTFGEYVDRIAKAPRLLNISLLGIIPLLWGVVLGRGGAQDLSFEFGNYASGRLFMAVMRRDTMRSNSVASVTSLMFFTRRMPSEASPSMRAIRQDEILKRAPPHIKGEIQALIGARFLPGDSERVELKLRPLRATRGGAVLTRPCSFDREDPRGKRIWPPHPHRRRDFWPAAIQASSWVEPISPISSLGKH